MTTRIELNGLPLLLLSGSELHHAASDDREMAERPWRARKPERLQRLLRNLVAASAALRIEAATRCT